jgi:16S rRNA (cytidine1402-2'-O)-methyltransferase
MTKFNYQNNLLSFNKQNFFKKIPKIINSLNSGNSVALVSDAGMPGICDPGEELVKDAKSNGINVVCIPGPCAATTALVTSGMPSSQFIFEGFLPKKKSERDKILYNISRSYKTTILFESPHRLKKLLYELKNYFGGDREIQVSRELTKKYEEQIGNNINEVINYFLHKEVLGEITIVIKGRDIADEVQEFDEIELKQELIELIKAGLSLPQASKYLAKKNKLSKNLIYNLYK